MNQPCYGCADRSPVCHAECERYREWKAAYEADKASKGRSAGEREADYFLYRQSYRAMLARQRERRWERERSDK